jgi:TusA-related sulfurtransferase
MARVASLLPIAGSGLHHHCEFQGFAMQADETLDLCGVIAPYCLLMAKSALAALRPGAVLEIQLRDTEALVDLLTILERSGEIVIATGRWEDRHRLWVRKPLPA